MSLNCCPLFLRESQHHPRSFILRGHHPVTDFIADRILVASSPVASAVKVMPFDASISFSRFSGSSNAASFPLAIIRNLAADGLNL